MRSSALLAILALSACAPPAPPVAPRPFTATADPAAYLPYQRSGEHQITGQAFLTTRGGDVKRAAGRTVTLDPATPYANEWFARFGAIPSRFDELPADPLFQAARKTTTADADGRFRFTNLAPGNYLVRTLVTWETGDPSTPPQGGVVATVVSVPGPTTASLILNQVAQPDFAAAFGIRLLEEDELAGRAHQVSGPVSGTSCQVGLIEPLPTEEAARRDLVINAARAQVDAVARITCRKHGMSLKPNCSSRIVCEGDGLTWGS